MNKNNNYSQMPLSSLNEHFQKWNKLLLMHQSFNIFFLKKTGMLPRMLQFVEWRQKTHNLSTDFVDLDNDILQDPYSLKKQLENSKKDVIVIARNNLIGDNSKALEQILQKYYTIGRHNLVLVHESAPHELTGLTDKSSLLYTNHYIYSPPTEPELITEYITNICSSWNLPLPSEKISAIISFCGNQPWLINEYIRLINENPNCDHATIEGLKSLVNRINIKFSTLPHLYIDQLSGVKVAPNILSEMRAFSLIGENNLASYKWLEKAIALHHNSLLNLKDNKIVYDHVDITPHFSTGELLLVSLFQPIPKIYSQDQVASTFYQDSNFAYSDWALAQVVSRFRKKLSTLGLPLKINTRRGKGYEFTRI